MKMIGKIGLALASVVFLFSLYYMFIIVPASEIGELERENLSNKHMDAVMESGKTMADVPGYTEAMKASEKKSEFGGYVFFASMLPFLLCLIATFKKDKMAMLGLVLSLGAFFIGAAYGTHMFS